MNREMDRDTITCRQAHKRLSALAKAEATGANHDLSATDRRATERHLETCARCALEYRILALSRTALDMAGSQEIITPDEDFFVALRARIARGPESAAERPAANGDESWAAALLLTARQLIPAMAVLLLLIVGATLLSNRTSLKPPIQGAGLVEADLRPRERVVFGDIYDYPAPTRDDVLQTLVMVEDKENGK